MAARTGFFRSLRTLHRALAAGMALFLLILLVLQVTGNRQALPDENLSRILQVIAVAASFLCSYFGFKNYRRKLEVLRGGALPAQEKLKWFRQASVTWWALQEAPGLFAAVSYFITGNAAFYALAVFHLLFLILSAPRRGNIIFLLGVTEADLQMTESGEADNGDTSIN